MVVLGSRNSRMRDFFDVFMLSRHRTFDSRTLGEAIEATFTRRQTPIPDLLPVALTSDFSRSREKQVQWAAYLRKNRLEAEDFPRVVEGIARFIAPVLTALSSRRSFAATWPPGDPWADQRLDPPVVFPTRFGTVDGDSAGTGTQLLSKSSKREYHWIPRIQPSISATWRSLDGSDGSRKPARLPSRSARRIQAATE